MTLLVASEGGFVWWSLLGLQDVPHYLIMGPLVCVILCLLALAVNVSLKRGDPLIPKDPAEMGVLDWIRSMFEGVVGFFVELLDGLFPHHEGRGYLWLIVPIFLYVLVGNLFGLIPGFLPPTDSLNTNAAVALNVFLLYHFFGFRSNGPGYLKHFWAPPGMHILMAIPIGFMLMAIELIAHVFRPVTLSLRLYGNITGDHAVFGAFLGLFPIGVPMVFLTLGLLISVVQAFVFSLLTSVYISLATAHDH